LGRLARGGRLLGGGLRGLRGRLECFRRLRPEALREPIPASLGVDQLLASSEERVAVVTDFEVQLRLGGARLPRRPARAARLDVVVLRMNPLLHGLLLGALGKTTVYHKELSPVRPRA